jgi:rhodanese-related sulfurtransferase
MMKLFQVVFPFVLFVSFTSACQNKPSQDTFGRISSLELNTLLTDQQVQLIDVRTPQEVARGYIKGMQHIQIADNQFAENLKGLDKDQPVVFYCARGNRSQRAASIALQLGFEQVYDVKDGFMGWSANGLAYVTD